LENPKNHEKPEDVADKCRLNLREDIINGHETVREMSVTAQGFLDI
jgi:hypothetical protein